MNQSLKDQIAIITGASSGIGAGIAHAMAMEGASVVINYPDANSEAKAQSVLDNILTDGGKGMTCMADVSKEDEVMKMFADTTKAYGTVDILVNNAGIQKDSPFEEMTLAEWNLVIGVNLTGQFLCSREAIKEFRRRGVVASRSCAAGKVICISSVHQVIPWAGHANYASSKGGIMMLMKTIAQEFAPHKIRVNSIAPGAIKTPINHQAWETPEAENKLLELIPYGRVGETSDVGKLASWLACDDSDYINGATIFIDGGMTLYPGFSTNG